MRTLEFTVDGQLLTKKNDCDFENIVAGTAGYLKAKFHFSEEEWSGCRKAASFFSSDMLGDNLFEQHELLDEEDSCIIPPQVLKNSEFKVTVTGVKDPNYRITTSKITIAQEVR